MAHLFNKGILLSGESNKLFNEVKDAYNDIKKLIKLLIGRVILMRN
jgi:hypothetical protein